MTDQKLDEIIRRAAKAGSADEDWFEVEDRLNTGRSICSTLRARNGHFRLIAGHVDDRALPLFLGARNDVLDLVAEVRRLREENAELREQVEDLRRELDYLLR